MKIKRTGTTTIEVGFSKFTLRPAQSRTRYPNGSQEIYATETKRADDAWLVVTRGGDVIAVLQGEDRDWTVQRVRSRNGSEYQLCAHIVASGDSALAALATWQR